ncbi:cyclin-I-like [Arapaima gigas]
MRSEAELNNGREVFHSRRLFFLDTERRCAGPQVKLAAPGIVMKCPGPSDGRLEGLLADALAREAHLWKAPVFKNGIIQGTDISAFQQEEAVVWLGKLSRTFAFCPETFALAVSILNRLLASVKTQPKYLRCIAITSLILAAKVNEEDEVIGSVKDIAVQSACNCSTAEIVRMERLILAKLHWDLYTATAVDFVHIFRGLVLSGHPHLAHQCAQKMPCLQAALWTRQVQHCMACHQLSQFKGSTLALAIITLELERLTPDWFSVFTDLLKKAQIDSMELIRCKEMADEYLGCLELSLQPSVVYIFDPANTTCFQSDGTETVAQLKKDKVDSMEVDEFYDGFKCLYNEEVTEEVGGKSASPCPPLQPPVN